MNATAQMGTILVVDDNPTNIQVLFDVLSEIGYRVAIAKSGESALQRLQSFHPDTILLDVMMPPGIDGFETCQRLKADPNTKDIPVIFMTALSDSVDKAKGLNLGAVDYITKPIQHEEALARIRVHLQLRNSQLHIRRMAYHDYLTGLPNRAQLHERLATVLAQVRLSEESGALLLIDLDHFKTINDALGHDVGDEVLRAIADRLQQFISEQVFVARLGGDEFVALMIGGGDLQETQRQALTLAQELIEKLSSPISLGERAFSVGASIGVVLFPEVDVSDRDIMRHADMALYRAKSQGRGLIQLYLPSLQAAAAQRLRLEEGLRRVITNQELELYFQPLVTNNGQMIGAEVLLRWHHPELGDISPDLFIPVAEETGLIHSIGKWVLEQSCLHLKQWLQEGVPFLGHLSINVCPWQFARPDFVEQVRQVIETYTVDARYLMLELTETAAVLYDLKETIEKLKTLRSLGIKIALDDFGTGYSSLAYLRELPLDAIKIDKIFVQELNNAPQHRLVEAIIAISQFMGLEVIAEGVESARQRDLLNDFGCHQFQGYFFSPPLPEPEFLRWMLENSISTAISTAIPTE